jgi:hypothetical protein
VSNLTRGGSFVNLKEKAISSRQFVRFWFCTDCERRLKRGEDAYYNFLAERPAKSYCEPLICYFAASISWRCALFYFETEAGVEWVADALECWRLFLLDQVTNPEPYSQYLISIEHPKWKPWNQGIGGIAMPNLYHVFSLVGPFVVVGLTRPNEFSAEELKLLDAAKLPTVGVNALLIPEVFDSLLGVDRFSTAYNFVVKVSTAQLREIAARQNQDK